MWCCDERVTTWRSTGGDAFALCEAFRFCGFRGGRRGDEWPVDFGCRGWMLVSRGMGGERLEDFGRRGWGLGSRGLGGGRCAGGSGWGGGCGVRGEGGVGVVGGVWV